MNGCCLLFQKVRLVRLYQVQSSNKLTRAAEGRLHTHTIELLQGADIQFHRHNRLDIALCKNLPIALIFLPAADIPTFVGEGKVALGITGRDQVLEHEAEVPPTATTGVEEILDLGFGRCKLQVQVPAKGSIQEPKGLVGKTIVTSFTNLAKKYFAELEKTSGQTSPTIIKYVGGSVEAACALGVADGIVDLVGKCLLCILNTANYCD
jgi:ATP phosphoribosyltransferase